METETETKVDNLNHSQLETARLIDNISVIGLGDFRLSNYIRSW